MKKYFYFLGFFDLFICRTFRQVQIYHTRAESEIPATEPQFSQLPTSSQQSQGKLIESDQSHPQHLSKGP